MDSPVAPTGSAAFSSNASPSRPARAGTARGAVFANRKAFLAVVSALILPWIDAAGMDFVSNGDFAENADGWALKIAPPAAASLRSERGLATVAVANGGRDAAGIQLRQTLPADLIEGTPYTVSFTAKADTTRKLAVTITGENEAAVWAVDNVPVGPAAIGASYTFTPKHTVTGATLAFCFGGTASSVSLTHVRVVPDPRLTWAPPILVDPVVKTLGASDWLGPLEPGKDYLIKLPSDGVRARKTTIDGGRNVVIMGGQIQVATEESSGIDVRSGDPGRIVHIEGVLMTHVPGGTEVDAIDAGCPGTILQVENFRVEHLQGGFDAPHTHADVFQPAGGSKEVRIDRLTGSSSYQGFFLVCDKNQNTNFLLRNVNLVMEPESFPGARGGYALWLDRGDPR